MDNYFYWMCFNFYRLHLYDVIGLVSCLLFVIYEVLTKKEIFLLICSLLFYLFNELVFLTCSKGVILSILNS